MAIFNSYVKLPGDIGRQRYNTSSTAQGGVGSFKNRKPIGWLLWIRDGRAKPLMDRKVIECFCLSIDRSIYLSIYLSVCLSIYLSIYLSMYRSMYLSMYLSIYLSVCLSVCLSICLSFCLSICLAIYLSISSTQLASLSLSLSFI